MWHSEHSHVLWYTHPHSGTHWPNPQELGFTSHLMKVFLWPVEKFRAGKHNGLQENSKDFISIINTSTNQHRSFIGQSLRTGQHLVRYIHVKSYVLCRTPKSSRFTMRGTYRRCQGYMYMNVRWLGINEDQYPPGTEDSYCPLHCKSLFKKKGLCGEQGMKLSKVNSLEDPLVSVSSSVSWSIWHVLRPFGLFPQGDPPESLNQFFQPPTVAPT